MGYDVVCSQVIAAEAGNVQGWVGLIYRDLPQGWSIELTRFHGTNLVSC